MQNPLDVQGVPVAYLLLLFVRVFPAAFKYLLIVSVETPSSATIS